MIMNLMAGESMACLHGDVLRGHGGECTVRGAALPCLPEPRLLVRPLLRPPTAVRLPAARDTATWAQLSCAG